MIHAYEESILDIIDHMVNSATDDELFASGYLRGHLSLAVADCEQENIQDIEILKLRVSQSLKDHANELNPADFALVHNFWMFLQEKMN